MHVSTSEVKYAQPGAVYRPPQEVLPPSVSAQYQGLRVSRVDTTAIYNVPLARKYEHGGGEVKADTQYANLPM